LASPQDEDWERVGTTPTSPIPTPPSQPTTSTPSPNPMPFFATKKLTALDNLLAVFGKVIGSNLYNEPMRPEAELFKDIPANNIFDVIIHSSKYTAYRNERLPGLLNTMTSEEFGKLSAVVQLETTKKNLHFEVVKTNHFIWRGEHTFGRTAVCNYERG